VWDRIRNAGKSGHFVLYGLLGISLAVAFPARAWRTLMLELGMMGGATELLQFFIEGRTPLVGDWLLDLAGAGAGLGLVTLVNVSTRLMAHGKNGSLRA
jgi:VanZ family protein